MNCASILALFFYFVLCCFLSFLTKKYLNYYGKLRVLIVCRTLLVIFERTVPHSIAGGPIKLSPHLGKVFFFEGGGGWGAMCRKGDSSRQKAYRQTSEQSKHKETASGPNVFEFGAEFALNSTRWESRRLVLCDVQRQRRDSFSVGQWLAGGEAAVGTCRCSHLFS